MFLKAKHQPTSSYPESSGCPAEDQPSKQEVKTTVWRCSRRNLPTARRGTGRQKVPSIITKVRLFRADIVLAFQFIIISSIMPLKVEVMTVASAAAHLSRSHVLCRAVPGCSVAATPSLSSVLEL